MLSPVFGTADKLATADDIIEYVTQPHAWLGVATDVRFAPLNNYPFRQDPEYSKNVIPSVQVVEALRFFDKTGSFVNFVHSVSL